MPKMNFKQALSAIAEMGKFFEGFKNIESIIEGASGLEQEIKDLEVSRDQVASEIKSLSKRKQKQEGIIAELSDRTKAIKSEMVSESKAAKKKHAAQKEGFEAEMAGLDESRQVAIKEHKEAMDSMEKEIAESKKVLASITRSIDRIKDKL